jgi:hypothetical protein
LATSVRLEEYRLACETLVDAGILNDTTNFIRLAADVKLKSNEKYRRRAKEAELLLTRCVRENENTPWAHLAQRELAYGLGISIRQTTLQPLPLVPAAKAAKLPRL